MQDFVEEARAKLYLAQAEADQRGGTDMKVEKEALGGQRVEPTEEELALVNRQSRKELTAAEVYLFAVRLCDNEVDRDGEQFPQATLEQLAELFVGKSGIFDHRWSAGGQTARIYRTEVVREEGDTHGAGRARLLSEGVRLHGADPGKPGPDRGDRRGYQAGGQRGLRGKAGRVLHLRVGHGQVRPREGEAVRRQAVLRAFAGGHRRLSSSPLSQCPPSPGLE